MDREKVIEALENADMTDGVIKMSNQFRDIVVELLKEQEPIWNDVLNVWTCPSCGQMVSTNYCRDCGQAVKWE